METETPHDRAAGAADSKTAPGSEPVGGKGQTSPSDQAPPANGTNDTFARDTLLDSSLRVAPHALDMRLQRDAVHARLFGAAPEEHRIGRYLVLGTLGTGGMGKVLHAHDETLGRDVALKLLHDAREGRHEQRLLREAQALARLSHPNVVRVYDVDEIDGRLCMAMELVHGTPLDRWQRTPRPWAEILEVYRQAGRGLAAAHAENLVHRDFKPANCILDEQGIVKVLDFGLARGTEPEPGAEGAVAEAERTLISGTHSAGDSARASRSQRMLDQVLTRTGTMLGTLAYMAPEQLMGRPADPLSDQFSFCVALHEALFDARPFSGTTAIALLYAIQSQPPVTGRVRPGLRPPPPWVLELLRRGLSVASHQRYPDMNALLAALDRGLARGRRRRGVAAGAVLLAGLGGMLTLGRGLAAEQPCEGLRDDPMPAWTDAERKAVGEAIDTTEATEVTDRGTREQVTQQLDAYASAWTEARADACEATWVRHEAGEQALALRMACLDDGLVRTRAAVEELSHATNARTIAFATTLIDELPAVAPCADVERLLRGPPPVPEALAVEAAEVRELIARSWAVGVGDGVRGIEAAGQAVAAADALTEAPTLRLEALLNRGHLLRTARHWSEAKQDLQAALVLAEQQRDDVRGIDVLRELLLLAADENDSGRASAWFSAISGKLARFEDDPRRVAQRSWLEGVVALEEHRVDDAVAYAQRAVDLYDALQPPAVGEQLEALFLLGEALRQHDDMAGAAQVSTRAQSFAQAEGLLALVPRALYRQGYLHYKQGRVDAATPLIERSVATHDAVFGELSAASIRSRLLLSVLLQLQGKLPQAIEQAALARRSFDERVPARQRGAVLKQLARLHRAQDEWGAAIASYREARSAWQEVPVPDQVELAMLDSDTADCLVLEGEPEQARTLYDAALARLTVETPPDDPRRAYPLLGRGRLQLARGAREAGIASLRAALGLQAALDQDPALHAELGWTLGLALWSEPATAAEAITLIQAARERFVEAEQTSRIEQADAWLADKIAPPARVKHEREAMKP